MSETLDSSLIDEALRHWREVFGYAFSLTGDAARAEDHCQEAIVRLASTDRPIARSTSLRPLLFRIVRNLVVDDSRRPAARSIDRIDEYGNEAEPVAGAADDPFREASRRERIRSVRAALDGLPAPWRAILFLRDGLGLSYAEIARIEERTEDVVRVTLHRARNRLRARLQSTSKEGTER